jgi:class 3 adenylate cyclase/streptogramin lyase
MRSRGQDHRLATVLFTDIVGSTRIASELGDRRWRVLLSHHHRIVREELKRSGGREVDTAGDGFYAVFDEPASAVRCACAVSDRVRELGIEIRAGLNIGQTEPIAGKPGGVAVHAASRIMAMAGPGDVLVSSTVRDLMPGSGFSFDDRGTHELRDVPGEWRVFAVTGVDGAARVPSLTEAEATERRSTIEPLPLLQRRGGRLGVIVVAVVVVTALVAVLLGTRSSPEASPGPAASTPGDRLAKIDPVDGKVVQTYDVGDHPIAVAFGEGSVWVANAGDKTVSRIDPASGRTTTIEVPSSPSSIVVGAGAVWVSESTAGTVSRIDPVSNTTETIDLGVGVGDHSVAVAVDDRTGAVWASVSKSQTLALSWLIPFEIGRIDPNTHTFSMVTMAGGSFNGYLAAGSGSVWFASDDGSVVRLDAQTGNVVWRRKFAIPFRETAVGDGSAWLASASLPAGLGSRANTGGAITPIALATNSVGDTVSVGGGPTGIALLGSGVYVSDALGVVHPYVAGAVLPAIAVGGEATGIAAGEGFLWVSVNVP